MSKLKIAIVMGSTRQGRNCAAVAGWVMDIARQRQDATFELVDIAEFALPLFDEPHSPMFGTPATPRARAWSEKIASFDGYLFVTPEYNHGIPAALKNALDFLYREWNEKAAGFVSYGGAGGARAIEQLRLVLSELMVATIRAQVMLSLGADFQNYSTFRPLPQRQAELGKLLDQLVAWTGAMKTLREPSPVAAGSERRAAA